ncbi:acyltransferase family protein [Paracoccus aurantiacus]|nr:acyltransferase family protein [Paracoccus aurantiacus]
MRYRPEIDGLRAVAVVPVILFHAGMDVFSGGYVGVDVFFVLSGYLISGIILDDLERGRFSLLRFYERRARRILPALFLTLAICCVLAWMWLLPRDMKDFSQSVAASALFVSNLLFLRESAYFDIESDLKPLLHTWSLSIEEQYYLLFPLLFGFLFRRFRGALLPAITGILLIGFIWSVWQSVASPQRAYFLLTTRAWELMGGVLAMLILTRHPPKVSPRLARFLALAGLILVIGAVFTFDEGTLFPGPFALIPVAGTMLVVIFATSDTGIGRALASGPLVLIGLISYSAYLFHQPMLAFLRYMSVDEPGLANRTLLVMAVFPLAWISWKYVETPFRGGQGIPTPAILGASVAGLCCFAILGGIGNQRDGYLRFDMTPDEAVMLHSLERSGLGDCADIRACLTPPPLSEDVLLIGDSNAFHFSAPLAEALARQDRRLISLTRGGCFPSDRARRHNRPDAVNEACRAHYRALFDYIRGDWPKPSTVLLSAAWASYFYGSDYFRGNPAQRTPYPDARVSLIDAEQVDDVFRRRTIRDEITALLTLLSQKFSHVCVVGPLPLLTNDFHGGVPALLAGIEGVSERDFLSETDELLQAFAAENLPPHVRVLFPHQRICRSGICETQRDGRYLYADSAHISDYGARSVFAEMFAGDPACLGAGDEE